MGDLRAGRRPHAIEWGGGGRIMLDSGVGGRGEGGSQR